MDGTGSDPLLRRGVSRRALMRGLAALAASGWLPQGVAQGAGGVATSASQFAGMSTVIAGYGFDDRHVADAMLRALGEAVGAAKLSRLANLATATPPAQLDGALKAANLESVAETVVAALYSGVVETPRGPRVISYTQALVWQACAWTKPNAYCGGQTNYWATPPKGGNS
jgi:hypothetical protein